MGFRNPVTHLRADQIRPGQLPPGVLLPDDSVTPETIVVGAITPPAIAPDAVTEPAIAPSAVTTDKLAANAVVAGKVAAGAITAVAIAANAITAEKIAANAIDGKVITGATIRTAASGQRVQITAAGLNAYNSSNTVVTSIDAADGKLRATGAVISGSDFIAGTIKTSSSSTAARVELAGSLLKSFAAGATPATAYLDSGMLYFDSGVGSIASLSSSALGFDDGGLIYGQPSLDIQGGQNNAATLRLDDTGVYSPKVQATTLAGSSASYSGPVVVTTAGKLVRLTGTFPVAAIPQLEGGSNFVRLFCGTDSSVGYNFRVTSTPNVGIYDGTNGMLWINSAGHLFCPDAYTNVATGRALNVASNGMIGTTSSLRAHKTAIDELGAGAIDAVLALRPVTFNRVADPDGPREVGLIAEEAVEAGMPDEFLYLSAAGELEGVAYERLAVYLIPVVQQLAARLARLEGAAA